MAYNANTNFANERKYLNNLISGGGGNAEWAKNQMKALNSAEQKYGNSGGGSGGGSSGSRSGGSSGGSSSGSSGSVGGGYKQKTGKAYYYDTEGPTQTGWVREDGSAPNSNYKDTTPYAKGTKGSYSGADLSRDVRWAGKTVQKNGYAITYDENGYAVSAINVRNGAAREDLANVYPRVDADGELIYPTYADGTRGSGYAGTSGGYGGGVSGGVAASNPYNENTDFANERAYLSNLMSNGNYGQQEWAKNRMGLLTATENEIMQQRLQQQQLQQQQLQQQQQQQQQVNDLSDYLRDMYRQQMQANLSALEGAYNANVTRLRRQGELAPQKYDAMRNLAAAQNELSRRNFGEYAAARGLNTGTSGQAELARSAELQRNLADLGAQEAEASGNLESELTALEQQYNAAVAQAQASGNADLANALYQELVRRQSAAAAQAEADAEQQRWLAEFEASRKDAADNLALAYAKLEASNRKSTGKGKSGTTDDIGETTETVSRTVSGNALLGTNGLPSYSDIRRTILTYMGQGNAASAQNVVNRYWKNMSAEQQNELSGLFGG